MRKSDEKWLLSSINQAWKRTQRDARRGRIYSERDIVTSFHRALRPHVKKKNSDSFSSLGKLRLLTELCIHPEKGRKRRYLDIALVEVDSLDIPQPKKVIAQFEFKYHWGYPASYTRSKVEASVRRDLRKIMDGNDDWFIWGYEEMPARTEYVFLGVVADFWHFHLSNGILHPNGKYQWSKPRLESIIPKIGNHKKWLNYFELHGPFSTEETSQDYILSKENEWKLIRVLEDGSSKAL